MAMSSEDLGASLPEETPQFGEGTAFARDRKTLESAGSPSRQGGAPGPSGASPAAQPQPPIQPAPPRVPLTQEDMRPGGPVFMNPRTAPIPSWREQLRTWANHPEANIIRRLSQRADAGLKNPGQQ
jgi:hypothetical protein